MKIEAIPLGKYQHYKNGKYYEVMGMARHSETNEAMVIYKALYDSYQIWVRPMEMFIEQIEYNGCHVPRFRRVEEK